MQLCWQAISCLLLGCSSPDPIEGVYTAAWTNTFYTTRDTIIVRPLSGQTYYQVTRRSMTNGEGKPRYQLQQWTGNYDPGQHSLHISSNGRLLLFRSGQLIMGSTHYKKI